MGPQRAPKPSQLSFTTKAGGPMTPQQIHNHLTTLCSNAAKHLAEHSSALPASPLTTGFQTVTGRGKGKGEGKGSGTADASATAAKAAAKAKSPSLLTTANVGKAGGPPPGGTPHPTVAAGSEKGSTSSAARSTRTAGGTRHPPAVPHDGYSCHSCGSTKHFRNECPK